jgi:foldase protein PrsA
LQRLALLAFGLLLFLLFLGFAAVQGIGDPSVPSGDVAVVEDTPEGIGTLSEKEVERSIAQAAAQAGLKPVPKPGDPQYDELKESALGEALDRIWIQGEAAEMGIAVSKQEVADELEKLKKQAFENEAQYKKFLKEASFTAADVDERVKVQMLSEQIQQRASENVPAPTSGEIEDYYEEAKAAQFTQPETREARALEFKDRGRAERAKQALEEDDTAKTWKRLAAKSSTTTAKGSGGLLQGYTEGQAPEPLDAAMFAAPPSKVEGPLAGQKTFIVFEVLKVTPEKVQPLKEVEAQISNQLSEQAQQRETTSLVADYSSKWSSRTFCTPDFTIERCANFEAEGPPPTAPPSCYEANPKQAPEACPAPVAQLAPARPGSISVLTPEGEKLAQRPQPANLEAAAPEGEAGFPPIVPGE